MQHKKSYPQGRDMDLCLNGIQHMSCFAEPLIRTQPCLNITPDGQRVYSTCFQHDTNIESGEETEGSENACQPEYEMERNWGIECRDAGVLFNPSSTVQGKPCLQRGERMLTDIFVSLCWPESVLHRIDASMASRPCKGEQSHFSCFRLVAAHPARHCPVKSDGLQPPTYRRCAKLWRVPIWGV